MRRAALALAGGLLQYLAFPPVGWWWTAPFGVAALVLAVRGSTGWRSAGLGLLCGAGFFLPLMYWAAVLGPDAWLALALALSAWFAGLGWAIWAVSDARWWWLAVPVVWVGQEWLRSRFPWGGLGWGRLAFSQPDSPLTGWVSVGGAPLLSFVIALLGCLLVVAAASWRSALIAAAAVASLLLVGVLVRPATQPTGEPTTVRIALIQGNVARPGLDFLGRPMEVLGNHERTTVALSEAVAAGTEPQPDAVVWPENSADIDPVMRTDAGAAVDRAANAIDAPILVGTVQEVPGKPQNVANVGLVWEPGSGPTDAYVKQHPVPFGEFLPLRPVLSKLITRFDRVPRDFIAGDTPGVLDLGPARIADVICFEISSDEIVRTSVREGGRAVVVQTNNATYAATAQPEQQFDISRLRARETGRSVLVAATTGITAAIEPDGTYRTLPVLRSGWLNPEVTMRDGLTPAVRYGGLVDGSLGLLAAAALVTGLWGRRRKTPEDPVI